MRILNRLVCQFKGHTGQSEGGTMMFTCPRCGGSFWQRHDFSVITKQADRLIAEGKPEEALSLVREEIHRQP